MRYFIFTLIAVMLAACSSKVASNTNVIISSQVSPDIPAPELADIPAPEEDKIFTGILIDLCQLPTLPANAKIEQPIFEKALKSCHESKEKQAIVEIGRTHIDPTQISLNIELENSELSVEYTRSLLNDTFEGFVNTICPKESFEYYDMQKDQVMSDRFGLEIYKLICRQYEDEPLTENYCFTSGRLSYCICIESNGTELDAFKNALISNMKLVSKTEPELKKDWEEYKKLYEEEKRKEKEKLIQMFGGIPKLKLDNPEVVGNLDKRIIQKVVRQHQRELLTCYDSKLEKTAVKEGSFVMNWIISPQGKVEKVSVKESSFAHKELEDCFVHAIELWRFPAPKGGGMVKLTYPFAIEIQKEIPTAP
jgi:TonB family protein